MTSLRQRIKIKAKALKTSQIKEYSLTVQRKLITRLLFKIKALKIIELTSQLERVRLNKIAKGPVMTKQWTMNFSGILLKKSLKSSPIMS